METAYAISATPGEVLNLMVSSSNAFFVRAGDMLVSESQTLISFVGYYSCFDGKCAAKYNSDKSLFEWFIALQVPLSETLPTYTYVWTAVDLNSVKIADLHFVVSTGIEETTDDSGSVAEEDESVVQLGEEDPVDDDTTEIESEDPVADEVPEEQEVIEYTTKETVIGLIVMLVFIYSLVYFFEWLINL